MRAINNTRAPHAQMGIEGNTSMQTKLRFCEPWSVVRLPDGTPVVVTHTEKRGQRVVQHRRDHMRWVDKDEPVELLLSPAELAHNYLETLFSAPICVYSDGEREGQGQGDGNAED